ncbi:MAG TPA: PASTA domain-containing protein [Spirochaetales bacterium]|nr:PASTA domain-containing protein [Spirochaetales bacterium]HPE36820.1 PASTA domain-containing protein [Spirochaetales bacterium]
MDFNDMRSFFSFKKLDELDPKHARMTIVSLSGVIILMAVSAVVAFFLTLRGAEQTLVPDVRDLELSTALIKLQEKELYPRVSLRFSDDPATRGLIIEQDPPPGAVVKAGRRIAIVVSRGAAQNRVGDYVGQDLDEVRLSLQTVFGSSRQLITVHEPPVYVYDPSPAGTILQQSPQAETELTGAVQMTFVVSRGPEQSKVTVPELAGLNSEAAARAIEKAGINFSFTVRPAEGSEKSGVVVAQLPVPGTVQNPAEPVQLVFTLPKEQSGMSSGLFTRDLPEYPYPLSVTLYAETPTGPRTTLVSVEHPGGPFSWPYVLPNGSVLELQVLNKVVARQEVGQ